MKHTASRRPLFWVILAIIAIAPLAFLGMGNGSQAAQTVAESPTVLPFSHQVHIQEVGVQCVFCHSDALRSPQAGLPSLQKCMACHASVTVDNADAEARVAQVLAAYEGNSRVQWPDVYKQPDFVYFSHRPHIAKGVSCQACHGDVEQMDLVEKTVEMNMGFCVECHREQVAKEAAQAESPSNSAQIGDQTGNAQTGTVATVNPHEQPLDMPRLLDCATCHK